MKKKLTESEKYEQKLTDWKALRDDVVTKYGRLNLHEGDIVFGTVLVGSHLLTGNVYERHEGIVKVSKDGMPFVYLTDGGITFARKRARKSVTIEAFIEYKKVYQNA